MAENLQGEESSAGKQSKGLFGFKKKHHVFAEIPEKDRIPFGQKIAFAFGQNTEWVAGGLVTSTLWLPFFNIGLGINPLVLGLILMIMRFWDAISDPLVGNISDNIRTPWGRRRPLMLIGALTTAALYPFIWFFPESVLNGTSWLVQVANHLPFIDPSLDNQSKASFVYLTMIGLVYFTSFTCWSMPYYGMQLELTPNYDERTRLTVVMTFVGKVTAFFTAWSFVAIVFVGTIAKGDFSILEGKPEWIQSLFTSLQPVLAKMAGGQLDDKPVVVGVKSLCWILMILVILLGTAPALFVKERYYLKEAKKQKKEPFWKSIGESIRCWPLWSLISVSFFLVMGYTSISGLGLYVIIYRVCGGDMIQAGIISGVKGSILAVTGILTLPFFIWLGEKFDKRGAVTILLTTCIVGHLSNFFFMTPKMPYLLVISGFFEASALGAMWIFLPSMKADVADWDELKTGRRREGSINAFYSWFIKTSLTLSTGISGAVLAFSKFDPKLEQQPDSSINTIFALYLLLPAVIWAIALASVWFYPLNRKRSDEIRTELEERRGYI
jgi:GPH family glycoside/pentoside/hexuronide:cation symporter